MFYFVNSCLCYIGVFLVLTPTYYCYFSLCFWCQIQKFIIKTNVKDLLPLFPSNSCLISSLGFQSFIHLKVMLMYVVRWWSSLILLPMAVWFSQYHLLWRNYLFPLVSSWLLIRVRFRWPVCVSYSAVLYCFDYSTFVISFEIRKCDASSLILSLKIALAIQGSLWSPANFRTVCSMSIKMYLLLFILINTAIFSSKKMFHFFHVYKHFSCLYLLKVS